MITPNLLMITNELRSQDWIKALLQTSNVFIVGGSVRDSFMNKHIKDIDLVVELLSLDKIKKILIEFGDVDVVGESFSVIKFKPFGYQGLPFDIAVPRMDRKIGEGHKGFDIITEDVHIETDLMRRDFTINSIALDIRSITLLDRYNGLDDLKHNILKATDTTAFTEDPLRILRGIGFASRFEFIIEPKTKQLMKDNSQLIKEISGERIYEEFKKITSHRGNTNITFDLLKELDIDVALFGKKMYDITRLGLVPLDEISFFYILLSIGGVDTNFLKERLKGDSFIEKNVDALKKIRTFDLPDEGDLRVLLFKIFNRFPSVKDSVILPPHVYEVLNMMENNIIPSSPKDLKFNGDDVMKALPFFKNGEIGVALEKTMRAALMNEFDWKDRNESLNFIKNINLCVSGA